MAIHQVASPDQPVATVIRLSGNRIRWIIYFHLTSVAYCLALTLADSGLLVTPRISSFFYANAEWPYLVGLVALPVCPLLVLKELIQEDIYRRTAVPAVIAEILLCMAHLIVLLPAVS